MKREMFPRLNDLRKVHIIQVIEVVRVIGEGTDEDPARMIYEYFDFEGKLLSRSDPEAHDVNT